MEKKQDWIENDYNYLYHLHHFAADWMVIRRNANHDAFQTAKDNSNDDGNDTQYTHLLLQLVTEW